MVKDVLLTLLALNTGLLGQSSVTRELSLPPGRPFPAEMRYQYGKFVVIHRNAVRTPGPVDHGVSVRDSAGKEVFARDPGTEIPGQVHMFAIQDAALSQGNMLAVSAIAWSSAAQSARVLMVYSVNEGRLLRIVRTSPIGCDYIAFDSRENIWCLGSDIPKVNEKKTDYNILYKYSADGKLLGEYLHRQAFGQGSPPESSGQFGLPRIMVGNGDTVYVWLPNRAMLLTCGSDGRELSRMSVPRSPGHAYYEFAVQPTGNALGLFAMPPAFERNALYLSHGGRWRAAGPAGDSFTKGTTHLIGADAEGAILWKQVDRKLIWCPTQ